MKILIVIAMFFSTVLQAAQPADTEHQKIEYLIAAVAAEKNVQFIRNGGAYSSQDAAKHLRLKLNRAGTRVKTAEDFIKYCASASSISGQPYQMKYSDGRVVSTESFLRAKLAEYPGGRKP